MERARPVGEALLRLLNADPDREFFDHDDCSGSGSMLTTPAGARGGLFRVGPPEQGRISGGVGGWGYAEGRECAFMESGGELILDRCVRVWES